MGINVNFFTQNTNSNSDFHFVNGRNLKGPFPMGLGAAMFGMGCFWGVEKVFWPKKGGGQKTMKNNCSVPIFLYVLERIQDPNKSETKTVPRSLIVIQRSRVGDLVDRFGAKYNQYQWIFKRILY